MQSCVLVNINSTKAFFKIENIIRNFTFKASYKGNFYSKQKEAKIQTSYSYSPGLKNNLKLSLTISGEQTGVFQEILIEKGNWFDGILCDMVLYEHT